VFLVKEMSFGIYHTSGKNETVHRNRYNKERIMSIKNTVKPVNTGTPDEIPNTGSIHRLSLFGGTFEFENLAKPRFPVLPLHSCGKFR
jgi:hypothetical protein